MREALRSFEEKLFDALVVNCVHETKGVNAHTMATKAK